MTLLAQQPQHKIGIQQILAALMSDGHGVRGCDARDLTHLVKAEF